VIGHRLADIFEAAAMEAIHIFCDQHPEKLQDILSGYFLQWILVTQNGLSG
jgi:hypothetical protein